VDFYQPFLIEPDSITLTRMKFKTKSKYEASTLTVAQWLHLKKLVAIRSVF
jgi:hypothetical protein